MDVNSPIIKFKKEVLDQGAEACLPANLSDAWLDYLDDELSFLDNMSDAESKNPRLTCSLAAIVTILNTRNGRRKSFTITVEELFNKMTEYRIEIGLEIVSRRTEIKFNPATLSNIFTDRSVKCRKKI